MDKQILLHAISPDDLKQIIKEIIKEEFIDFKRNLEIKESDILLTRTETCELLKIDSSTLWHWTKKGKITSYGIGNRVYYKKDEVLKSLIKINC